jgi:hypothetical protein
MLNMRNAAIAAIISASLSLLAMSVAQAQGGEKSRLIRLSITPPKMPPWSIARHRRWTGHSTWNSRGRREARIIMVRTAAKRVSRKALDRRMSLAHPGRGTLASRSLCRRPECREITDMHYIEERDSRKPSSFQRQMATNRVTFPASK